MGTCALASAVEIARQKMVRDQALTHRERQSDSESAHQDAKLRTEDRDENER
jgi:hypothetical protein